MKVGGEDFLVGGDWNMTSIFPEKLGIYVLIYVVNDLGMILLGILVNNHPN